MRGQRAFASEVPQDGVTHLLGRLAAARGAPGQAQGASAGPQGRRAPAGRHDLAQLEHDAVRRAERAAARRALARDEVAEGVPALLVCARVAALHVAARACARRAARTWGWYRVSVGFAHAWGRGGAARALRRACGAALAGCV